MAEPQKTKVATIASWLGKFAPSCALAGLVGIQLGVIPPLGGFLFFQLGLLAGLLSFGFGIAAFIATRGGDDERGRSAAWLGLASGMVMITAVVAGSGPGLGSPPINDITTNLDDPPSFASSEEVSDYADRDMSYPREFVPTVREHYPDLESITLRTNPRAAYDRSLAAAEALGWTIVYKNPTALTFDAQDTSMLFKFVDDVSVRVRGRGTGSLIDVRSKSRDGRGDLGVNAKRIRSFRDEVSRG
jgi:uncharacterized protein (DUF1499 family)